VLSYNYYVNKQSTQASTDSPRFATVRFATIHNNDGFQNSGLKILKKTTEISKNVQIYMPDVM